MMVVSDTTHLARSVFPFALRVRPRVVVGPCAVCFWFFALLPVRVLSGGFAVGPFYAPWSWSSCFCPRFVCPCPLLRCCARLFVVSVLLLLPVFVPGFASVVRFAGAPLFAFVRCSPGLPSADFQRAQFDTPGGAQLALEGVEAGGF